jgi:teichuronic acid biosynthesis glycosyltransferase TuaH
MSNPQELSYLKGRDIIIIGLQAWYTDIGSNCKSIARELSIHNRVLYINMPLDRKTAWTGKKDPNIRRHAEIAKGKGDDLYEAEPNLWNYYPHTIIESINWLPKGAVYNFINRINNRRFAAEIRKAAARMGFKDYVLFNDNDIFRSIHLKEFLKPSLYIYYSRDNLTYVGYWKKHGEGLEPVHIAKADLAVANSTYLANRLKQYNPRSYYIGQGCNLSLFRPDEPNPVPADLEGIPHPIIGYVGAITGLRLDERIILELAKQCPDMSIVMVGPEDDQFQASTLHQCSNVFFPGKKAIPELPAYIAAFDICINPQLVNDMTIGNYPLKIDEYLAMGKPVIATRTEAMDIFGDTVYLAGTPADYPVLARKALSENNEEKRGARIRLARSHTWAQSIAALDQAILNTIAPH